MIGFFFFCLSESFSFVGYSLFGSIVLVYYILVSFFIILLFFDVFKFEYRKLKICEKDRI